MLKYCYLICQRLKSIQQKIDFKLKDRSKKMTKVAVVYHSSYGNTGVYK